MAWYDTGTVAVTNGSTIVTGTGTNFIVGAQVGEAFYGPDSKLYEIQTITSATVMVLADAYLGSTQSGQAYQIVPTQSLVSDLAVSVTDLISDFADVRDYAGNGKFNDGAVGTPGITFTQDQDNGLYRIGANNWALAAGGQKIVDVSTSGIGVTGNTLSDSFTANGSLSGLNAGSVMLDYNGSSISRLLAVGADANTAGTLKIVSTASDGGPYIEALTVSSTGIDVTGTATMDGLVVDGNSNLTNTSAGASAFALVLQNQSSDTSTAVELGFDNTSAADKTSSLTKIGAERVNSPYAGDTNLYFKTQTNGGSLQRLKIATTGDISFYEDTGTTAKFFWDASAESLGIGTSSPQTSLSIETSGTQNVASPIVTGQTAGVTYGGLYTVRDGTGDQRGLALNVYTANVGLNEAMRIDSEGNLLVGTSDSFPVGTGDTTAGIALRSDGLVCVQSLGAAMVLSRRGSEGGILELRKDGDPVGSIGTFAGGTYIGNGTTGIRFSSNLNAIIPVTSVTGEGRGSAIDLGYVSGSTVFDFKDLYLSGGVYLGGTGAANKLEDYEEGTFAAALSPSTSGTITLNGSYTTLSYTRVGRLVTVTGLLVVSGTSSPVGTAVELTTLPFTSFGGAGDQTAAGGAVSYLDSSANDHTPKSFFVAEGSTTAVLYITSSAVAAGDQLRFSFTYVAI